jgi:hypothetical protein
VKDRAEGHRRLLQYAPGLPIDSAEATDVLFQINRPRQNSVGVADLTINRLTKWSVDQVMMQTLLVQVSGGQTVTSEGSELILLRLELDINTAPTFRGRLQPDQSEPLYEEMMAMGADISEKGLRA